MRINLLPVLAVAALGIGVTAALPTGPAPAGAISGTITFTGTPPKMRPIDMAKEPTCAAQHATPVMNENVVTGAGNTIKNVVVYISAGDHPAAAPTTAVRYDQKGCEYVPHVAVMQAGQPLEIYNNDKTSHNIHPLAKLNPEWNKSQPPGSPPLNATYAKPEFIAVKCNIHPWMHGYFAVLSTAHYAISDADGKFTISGLAPGTYTVTAWHERFGTQSQQITVPATGAATSNFVYKVTPY